MARAQRLSVALVFAFLRPSLQASYPWTPEFQVGQGINSATLQPKSPKCVSALDTTEDDYMGGLKTTLEFRGVTSTKMLRKSFGFGLGLSIFGIDADTSYKRATTLSQYEAAYLLSMKVEKATITRLKESVEWDEDLNDRENLLELCGDSFVESVQGGGLLYAIWKTTRESYDTLEESTSSIKVGPQQNFSGSIEAKVEHIVEQSTKSNRLEIHILSVGGDGKSWKADTVWDIAGLKDKLKVFPSDVNENPWPFKMTVKQWGSYFTKYKPTANMDVEAQRDSVAILRAYFDAVSTLEQSLSYVQKNHLLFSALQKECLQRTHDMCKEAKKRVTIEYNSLCQDGSHSVDTEALFVPNDSCLPGPARPDDYVGCFNNEDIKRDAADAWKTNVESDLYSTCRQFAIDREHSYFGFGGDFHKVKEGKGVCYLLKEPLDFDASKGDRESACGDPCPEDRTKWCGKSDWFTKKKAVYHLLPPAASPPQISAKGLKKLGAEEGVPRYVPKATVLELFDSAGTQPISAATGVPVLLFLAALAMLVAGAIGAGTALAAPRVARTPELELGAVS